MREFKKEYGDQIEGARKKWNRSILCIEPIAELTGKCVVSGRLVCDRVDGRNRIEIEFLLSKTPTTARHNVIPIEVKSNNDYTTVSLERFKEKFPGYCAERYVLHPGNADFTGDIKYLPLYMTPLLVNRRGRV